MAVPPTSGKTENLVTEHAQFITFELKKNIYIYRVSRFIGLNEFGPNIGHTLMHQSVRGFCENP